MPARSAHGNPERAPSPTAPAPPVAGRRWSQNEPEEELVWIRHADRPLTARGFRRDGHGVAGLTMPGVGVGEGAWRDLGEDAEGSGKGPALPSCGQSVSSPAPVRQGLDVELLWLPPSRLRFSGPGELTWLLVLGKPRRFRILTPCERHPGTV